MTLDELKAELAGITAGIEQFQCWREDAIAKLQVAAINGDFTRYAEILGKEEQQRQHWLPLIERQRLATIEVIDVLKQEEDDTLLPVAQYILNHTIALQLKLGIKPTPPAES